MGNIEKKLLKGVDLGDLICVEWTDASVGKSSGSGIAIDIPVKSWGVFIGVFGERSKHIVIAQNSFKYSSGVFDIDYTAVPLTWTLNVVVIAKACVESQVTRQLLNSFLLGGRRALNKRTFQRRVVNHGGFR
ncbi:MAG: hypothetical protein OEY22_11105 [Candidatus Bathyarchaeota archaeon]|nr:hypothetical protein [Candidatus Bathyarchaeota archaeon]